MSHHELIEQIDKAMDSEEWGTVQDLLDLITYNDDVEAKIYKGTILSLSPNIDMYNEGIALLRALAEEKNGHAAHNLATALNCGVGATKDTRGEFEYFMRIAVDSGFEKNVSSDPDWWSK